MDVNKPTAFLKVVGDFGWIKNMGHLKWKIKGMKNSYFELIQNVLTGLPFLLQARTFSFVFRIHAFLASNL